MFRVGKTNYTAVSGLTVVPSRYYTEIYTFFEVGTASIVI